MTDYPEIDRVFDELLAAKQRPAVFVTGYSGSGKTTLCRNLKNKYGPKVEHISFDWWIIDPSPIRRAKIVSDYNRTNQIPNPLEWYDWAGFRRDIQALKDTGKMVLKDAWNQESGEKDLDINLSTPSDCVILIEGMYLFEPESADLADFKIMIEHDLEAATSAAHARQANRNPEEYLAIKALWYRQYDEPYMAKHRSDANLIITRY